MNPPYDLVGLQTVDLEIDRWERKKVNLPELGELQELLELRKSVESEHGKIQEELRSLDLDFDRSNGELQMMEERLDMSEKKLFGGGMSSKETENRRLEVESLRVRINQQEARALDLMDRRDQVADRIERVASDLEKARRGEGRLAEVVRRAWEEIDARLQDLRLERAFLISPVPPRVVKTYEHLRRHKGGVAAGRLEGNVCGGCHLALSESERSEAAESNPPRCPHCRRILVF